MDWKVEPTKEGCKSFMDDLSVRKIPGVSALQAAMTFPSTISDNELLDWSCHRTMA